MKKNHYIRKKYIKSTLIWINSLSFNDILNFEKDVFHFVLYVTKNKITESNTAALFYIKILIAAVKKEKRKKKRG